MIKHFIRLEWKQFLRSKSFSQSLAIKIVIGFLVLYFLGSFLLLGIGAYFLLKDIFPGQDPVVLVNNYLIYWFLIDLIYRFFVQKIPALNIKPLMVFPIKKKTVIHYLLGKSGFSFYNFIPLFFYLPFCIVLLFQGYSAIQVIPWFFALVFFEGCINYLNLLINKSNSVFYGLVGILLVLAGLHYFGAVDIAETFGFVFNRIYEVPYAFTIPLLLLILLYRKNFKYLYTHFYLDEEMRGEEVQEKTRELNWLNRFGASAVFLKNDIRMILRNKRPKQVLLTAFIFLFYGLLFFSQDAYKENLIITVFASIFITGGFLMTFGQLVPSWDSEYYKLLMSQNIPYRNYIESKWHLMVFGTLASFILSTPYLYYGWRIFAIIAAGALFNIGLNSFITLWGGAINRVPVELNVKAKAFSNAQNFSLTQMLIALPKLVLPILFFYIPYLFFGVEVGVLFLAVCGLLGLVFKNFFMNKIVAAYQKGKYKTLEAYAEKS